MRPVTVEEAAGLLADAAAAGRRVRIGEDLSTEGLDRVLEHEAGDLTCTVEAGIRLSALQETLSAAGQRLSLDPPGDPTIGACLARRLSGPLSHRFGTPRDLVLGVTLVLGDGTIASSGGKVVKNVAGYDLGKLVCGSEGRLALIARVSLRLHPLPAASGTLVVETDDAPAIVRALRRSQLHPSALDVVHPGRVAVLFEGSERAVAAQLDQRCDGLCQLADLLLGLAALGGLVVEPPAQPLEEGPAVITCPIGLGFRIGLGSGGGCHGARCSPGMGSRSSRFHGFPGTDEPWYSAPARGIPWVQLKERPAR